MNNKQFIELHHLETLFQSSELEKGKLNAIISPMGSGKSTLQHKVLEKNDTAMILYPYITSRRDFEDLDNNQFYFTNFVTRIMKQVSKNLSVDDFYFEYVIKLNEWLNEHKPSLILLDEGDFFFVQANAMKNYGSTKWKGVDHNIVAGKITYITMQMLSQFALTLSFSACKYKVPHGLADEYFYDQSMIKEHIIDLEPNTNIKSFTVIPSTPSNTSIYSVVSDFIGSSEHTLVYKSQYNKVLMDTMLDKDALFILRSQNAPYVLDEVTGTRVPYGSVLQENYKEIGIDGSQLSDELYLDNNTICIGVSSSRAVSITKEYSDAKIVIFSDVTASAIQCLGRFRNTPVDVLWVGSFDIDRAETFDPYIKQYVKQVNIQTTQLNLLSTTAKDDVNEYLSTIGSNTPTFTDYQDKGGIATTKQFYFFIKELGYTLSSVWVKGTSTTKGKRIGKSVSTKTIARQAKFKQFMDDTNEPVKTYSKYLAYCKTTDEVLSESGFLKAKKF